MTRALLALVVVLILAPSTFLSCGRTPKPEPKSQGWLLPDAGENSVPAGDVPKVTVVPSVPAYTIAADLSNVEDAAMLAELPSEHRELLARNGFLISTCPKLDMYEVYEPNPAPFITADCVFHAYHILLADTLSGLEEDVLAPRLEALVRAAHKKAAALCAEAPPELAHAADSALAFWATAHRLMDPEANLEPSVRDAVTAELARITEGTFIGRLPGDEHPRDYTVYVPIAAYDRSDQMRRYFRCNRFLTLTPVRFQTTDEARTCALTALALALDDEAWRTYQDLSRLTRFLAGEPEDVSPLDVIRTMRSVFGKSMSPAELADEESASRLRDQLVELKRPAIADQPQDVEGADPMLGWGMRVLAPGATIRAQAFQRLGAQTARPSGEDVAHLLGNTAFQSGELRAAILAPAKQILDQAVADYRKGLDVHTSALVVLSKLSTPGGDGYPGFMNSPAWPIKTANTQLGAWSQIEHDVFLYAKATGQYRSGYDRSKRFWGYVEPVPEYYAALADLVRRTRIVFESLNAFDRAQSSSGENAEWLYDEQVPSVASDHYETLEELLLTLKAMSEKELESKPFTRSEIEFLAGFGLKLKRLALNVSNLPDAYWPMSDIVPIAREYRDQESLYVGTGRPLQMLVIVPWQGKLYWCTGAVYSYYEFTHPLSDPISDERWETETLRPFATQEHRPWLCRFDVGLQKRSLSRETLAKWLPDEDEDFGTLTSYQSVGRGLFSERPARRILDLHGFAEPDDDTLVLAAKAFAEQHHKTDVRCALYTILEPAAPDLRKKTALQTLSNVIAEVSSGANAYSADHKLWIYLSLKLVTDQFDDPAVKAKLDELKPLKDMDKVLKECMDDPELSGKLKALGLGPE